VEGERALGGHVLTAYKERHGLAMQDPPPSPLSPSSPLPLSPKRFGSLRTNAGRSCTVPPAAHPAAPPAARRYLHELYIQERGRGSKGEVVR